MALLRNGGADFNSTDPAELTAAGDSLVQLIDLVNVEIGPGDYQKLAEGTSHVRYSWSGNMNYAQWYLPKGTDVSVLGYYYPPTGGWEVANDAIVISKDAQSPVLAHLFIDFLMRKEVALTNFGYEGFQPPLQGVTPDEFMTAGYIPPNLANTLVSENDFTQGQAVVPLSPEDDQPCSLVVRAYSRRHPQRGHRGPRRSRQDDPRGRHAVAIRRVPVQPGRRRAGDGLDGPGA